MLLVYVAGRLYHDPGETAASVIDAVERAAREVAEAGAMPVFPQKMCENMAGTLTPDFWLGGAFELARRCDAVYAFAGEAQAEPLRGATFRPILYSIEEVRALARSTFHSKAWMPR